MPESYTPIDWSLLEHACNCSGSYAWPYGSNPYESLQNVEVRSLDGIGNNATNPDWGSVEHPFVRIADNSYSDDVGALPGTSLVTPDAGYPTPRAVSDAIMAQPTDGGGTELDIPNAHGSNDYMQFFGQFLTHDIAETDPLRTPPEVIPGVAGLPFPFVRSDFVLEPQLDDHNVRQQINEETSFLDLTQVYGNNQTNLDYLRADTSPGSGVQSAYLLTGADGLLPTFNDIAADTADPTDTGQDVLDAFFDPNTPGLPNADQYAAGDNRVDQQLPLASHQTIWALEHNFQVDKLAAMFPGWTQDELFNAARSIVEAEWQHVVYDEYLPALLGPGAISPYTGYDPTVDPSIINEFTTAAFRFGHDQSRNFLQFLSENGTEQDVQTLAQLFGFDVATTTVDDMAAIIRGQLSQPTQEIDGFVVDGNRNALFGIGGGAVTVDLETFDIGRGRDHGISDFNAVREALGLTPYASLDSFGAINNIATDRLDALKALYGDISKLDTVVGGLLEQHVAGSQLGETFHILTVMQFEAIRDGDAFYYENLFSGNDKLIHQIDSTSLADIIGRNSNIDYLYHDAFAAHNRIGGTDGVDHLPGTSGKDLLIGFDGRDYISGFAGDDDIYGGGGNDRILGGLGNDRLFGEDGKDYIHGYKGNDYIDGGEGNDDLRGGGGNDYILGGYGNDKLRGDLGDDTLCGGDGRDTLKGGSGEDILFGGDGRDKLDGNNGNDILNGGADNDILKGGNGMDYFVFEKGTGHDKVLDFKWKADKLDLSDFGFNSIDEVHDAAHQSGNNTFIDLGGGDQVQLCGVKEWQLSADNVIIDDHTQPVIIA